MSYDSRCIRDAMEEINRTYFLPAIQREFVWEPFRVERLFDSIMADYPIGSFLFWRVREENKDDWTCYKFICDFDKKDPHNRVADLDGINRDISLVLDGQQRLTALNIGLKGSYRYLYYNKWRETKLYLNLLKPIKKNEENPEELEYQFQFRQSSQTNNPDIELWYKVGKVLNSLDSEKAKRDIKGEIENLDDDKKDDARELVGRLHARIHTLPLINYHVEKSDDYDRIVEIFIRANTAGKTLEYSDILLSTATAKWRSLNAKQEIQSFTDQINEIGRTDYRFGKDFVLKGALYLTEGLPIKYKVANFTKNNLEKIEDNWPTIKYGLENAVRLISKFGLNDKNITASMALLPIAYYLVKLQKKNYVNSTDKDDVYNQSVIQKWLILVFLKNSFGGSSDTTLSTLRDELASMADYSQFPFIELNKRLGIAANFSDEEIENLLATNYKTKYSYLILSLLYPDRDWKDNHYQEDHIFPKSLFTSAKLKARGYDDDKTQEYFKYYNTVLNLQLLTETQNKEKNKKDFDEWLSSQDNNFKNRHSIPLLGSYQFDNFITFIEARKKILGSRLKTI